MRNAEVGTRNEDTGDPSASNHSVLGTRYSDLGRLLGVDTGTVRVGLAVCDVERKLASPLETYTRKSPDKDAAFFARLVAEQQAVGFVVGLPVHMNGDEGVKAKEARAYGAWLTSVTGLPVAFHDERCTTAAAEEMLWDAGLSHKKRKERRDKLAAALILQAYLDVERELARRASEGELPLAGASG